MGIKGINLIRQDFQYLYVDLGQREYCTVMVNKQKEGSKDTKKS